MKGIQTLKDIDCVKKVILVRVDFNVPMDGDGNVSDLTRVRAALPTIQYLLKKEAKVLLVSHLGRPKGRRDEAYSLKPVARVLEQLLNKNVTFVEDCIGESVSKALKGLKWGEVALLENVRFYKEEEANDPDFAKQLAEGVDIYVNDAFGAAHRAHASTCGVAGFVPEVAAGFLIEKELDYLESKLESAERPFTVILGGAKVSDKIKVIEALLEKADIMLIGGAMAYTFALARGKAVGNSLVEREHVETARRCMELAEKRGVELLLPVDTLVTEHLDFEERSLGPIQVVEGDIPEGWQGVDIGPKTMELFDNAIAKSKTILWNGPMGVFEIDSSAQGTFSVAKALAESKALTIIGGGDSVKAVNYCGYGEAVSFISTGGGASLELLEGKELPGISVLKKVDSVVS